MKKKVLVGCESQLIRGFPDAQYAMGVAYANGRGVEYDRKKAVEWWRKAAEGDVAPAWYNLGNAYENGLGVEEDEDEARRCFERARDLGDSDAQERLWDLDDDDDDDYDRLCFITTAVCKDLGEDDNCYELTMFRKFRDQWLVYQSGGQDQINEYYRIAPSIVDAINHQPNRATIYRHLNKHYLAGCLSYIENGENEKCRALYTRMVRDLQRKYCSPIATES